MNPFVRFMASTTGRIVRVVAGIALIALGLLVPRRQPSSFVELPATPSCPPFLPSTLPASSLLPELLPSSATFSGPLQRPSWPDDTPPASVLLRRSSPACQHRLITPSSSAPVSVSFRYSSFIILFLFVSFAFYFSLTYQFFHEIAFLPCCFVYLLSSPATV